MNRTLKTAALSIPPIRRLHEDRDRLLELHAELTRHVADLIRQNESLRLQQHTPAAQSEKDAKSTQAACYLAISRLYEQLLVKDAALAPKDGLVSNSETWLNFNQLGTGVPYYKTYDFSGDYINASHEYYATCPRGRMGFPLHIDIGINGWIQSGDALKLYEIAYFTLGGVLELGTHEGLSTTILAQALQESGRSNIIETVDINPATVEIARQNMRGRPGEARVNFNVADAATFMRHAVTSKRKFSFIFVDHWHGYEATCEAIILGKELLEEGGFILFHDYNSHTNAEPNHHDGVYQAVCDTLLADKDFSFFGNSGCTGLFKKH